MRIRSNCYSATDDEALGDGSGNVSVACLTLSWGRGCGQGQGSLRPQAASCVAATTPSPSPIQKQSASRLSSTAPMNQGPSPGLPVVKDKLETYITQMTVGTQTGRSWGRGRG